MNISIEWAVTIVVVAFFVGRFREYVFMVVSLLWNAFFLWAFGSYLRRHVRYYKKEESLGLGTLSYLAWYGKVFESRIVEVTGEAYLHLKRLHIGHFTALNKYDISTSTTILVVFESEETKKEFCETYKHCVVSEKPITFAFPWRFLAYVTVDDFSPVIKY